MRKYANTTHKVLLIARKLARAGGGTVSRTHLRLQLAGVPASQIDEIFTLYNVKPSILSTSQRGRPVTIYSLPDIERACQETNAQEVVVDTYVPEGYAKALLKLDQPKFVRLASRVLHAAQEMAVPNGYVTRAMLKVRVNNISADDLTFILEVFKVVPKITPSGTQYELASLEKGLLACRQMAERLELQGAELPSTGGTTITSISGGPKPW
jgi:hypothetical protein